MSSGVLVHMRASIVFSTVLVAGLAWSPIAAAKGPGAATLTGPDINGEIELEPSVQSTSAKATAWQELMEMSGIWFASHIEPKIDRPRRLGTPMTLTWDGYGPIAPISQTIYLEADGGAVIYTPDQVGLGGWGGDPEGWHRVRGDIAEVLEILGYDDTAAHLDLPDQPVIAVTVGAAVSGLGLLLFRKTRSRIQPRANKRTEQ